MSSKIDSFRPLASVVFVGIPDFAQKTVAEQARLRAGIDTVVAAGIGAGILNEADRIVLDSPDGTAIVVLGNPCGAMDAAMRMRDADKDAAFRIGINHGPVTLAGGARNDSLLLGDGIDIAVVVAGFTPPGELRISRSFRDALAVAAPAAAARFNRVGTFTDVNVRVHELFTRSRATDARGNRRAITFAALLCVAILALGGAARLVLQSMAAARQPAILVFDIRPQGDIYLDGALKGKVPAITRLQVAPGAHSIEVRNGRFTPFVTEVNVGPGEQMEIRHSFIAPAKPKQPGLLERLKFWQ